MNRGWWIFCCRDNFFPHRKPLPARQTAVDASCLYIFYFTRLRKPRPFSPHTRVRTIIQYRVTDTNDMDSVRKYALHIILYVALTYYSEIDLFANSMSRRWPLYLYIHCKLFRLYFFVLFHEQKHITTIYYIVILYIW